MTPRTPQCEVFCPLLSNSKQSGVTEGSKSPTLGVGVSSSHFTQSGVATLVVGFIKHFEEAIWLLPIIVVLKKNGKLRICVDFRKLNVVIKKDLYPLPFTDEVINTIAGHEVYTFLDGFYGYHQISITSKN